MSTEESDLLFAGLKVLDVGTWIAGPVSTTILADFGAEVIKVEQPGVGDPYRALANSPVGPRASVNYAWLTDARNKRGITLNLKHADAREVLLKLVRECDVYVTNQPFVMRRQFGLTYEDLAPLNERMIYASLTAYGELGPESELEGFDGVAWWGRSGMMDLVRAPGAAPGGSVPGMGDHPTAVSLYAAIVTALMRRERTGKGGKVHTSLLANGLWANTCLASAAFTADVDFSPMKNRGTIVAPGRVTYETSDGKLLQLYMVRTQAEMDALLIAAEATEILADDRFSDPDTRLRHMSELIDALRSLFVTRSAKEWMAVFRAADVPVSVVAQLEDLGEDPQIKLIGAAEPPSDPAVGAPYVIKHPLNIDGLARVGPMPAPSIGQHTDEVLVELGYDATTIARLHAEGAI